MRQTNKNWCLDRYIFLVLINLWTYQKLYFESLRNLFADKRIWFNCNSMTVIAFVYVFDFLP